MGKVWPLGVALLSGLALAGCGNDPLHAHTDFPVIDGARVVADTEQPSGVTASVGHYLILLDPSPRGVQLARAERAIVRRFGWEWRHGWTHNVGDWESPQGDYVRFGAATGRIRGNIPTRIKNLIATTPGPASHKVVVGMAPPGDY